MISAFILSQLLAAGRVDVPDRVVRVADVVAGSRAATPIFAVPRGSRAVVLSRAAVARLASRRTGGRVDPAGEGDIVFVPRAIVRTAAAYEEPPIAVTKGAVIEVTTAVGPVRIARSVVALQGTAAGHRFFVRDEDGQVFTAAVGRDGR